MPTRQRRPALAALALVLVLGGAALSAFLVLNSGEKQSVLVLAKDVEYGHQFDRGDFREAQVSLSLPGNSAPVRFGQLEELVGKRYRAQVRILAGTILTNNMVSLRVEVPGPNFGTLGVAVPEGQYPAGLIAGDKVKVLYTPNSDKGVSAGGVKEGRPLSVGLTLVDVAYVTLLTNASGGQGGIVATLVVRNEDLTPATVKGLPLVAAANAIDAISLVELPVSTSYQTGDGA